jgi:hypothetical protein
MLTKKALGHFTALGAFLLACSTGLAQTPCRIKVLQNDQEITPSKLGIISQYTLQPQTFQIEVSPASCAPTIASIADMGTIKEITEKPLIYASRWAYSLAANPSDSDKLLWWAVPSSDPQLADPEVKKPPNPASFDGRQYLELCKEFSFCPKVYPIFSSGHPFKSDLTGSKSLATFNRLDDTKTIADAAGKNLVSAIYTLWRKLPAEFPMAEPQELLFKPEILVFTFQKSN